MDELQKALGVSKHALARLADSGSIETRRADGLQSPVLMRVGDVKPLAAIYKDVVNARGATALLRVPLPVLRELAAKELIVRIEGAVARMLDDEDQFRMSSVRALLLAIKERAGERPAPPTASKLMDAVRALRPTVPWDAIIAGIAGGDLPIQATKDFGRDWRFAVAVEVEHLLGAVGTHRGKPADDGGGEPWLTRDAAAQLLGTDETAVWAMGRDGILPKREGEVAMFARTDVEAAAARWIFGQEMRERSVFGNGRELNFSLKSIGIEPAFTLRNGRISVFTREKVEAALARQP